jgi:hypothetical protein
MLRSVLQSGFVVLLCRTGVGQAGQGAEKKNADLVHCCMMHEVGGENRSRVTSLINLLQD